MKMSGEEKEHRFPPHCRVVRSPSAEDLSGWKEAMVSSGDHLMRVLEEYGELGFDCLLQEVGEGEVGGCSRCFRADGQPVFRVYVRRRDRICGA